MNLTENLNKDLSLATFRREFRVPYGAEAGILKLMDDLLVASGHPLAFQPGTQEFRFSELAKQGYQFGAQS